MNIKKKKNIFIYLIIILFLISLVVFIILYKKNPKENIDDVSNSTSNIENENIVSSAKNSNPPVEEEISSYSTKLTGSSENRLTNIRLTCNKLNGKILNIDEIFSFETSIGPSTSEDGYKEATAFCNGKEIKALGGGNCQVSSTLYNAVLAVNNLKVIERHEHGKKVSYVPDGKDAAVSYGSIDFKFKNTSENKIKLYFSTDNATLLVRIVKLV